MPPGMTASRPPDMTKYYVIAPTQVQFAMWVKKHKHNLQHCNYIGTSAGMKGLGFHNPEIELVIVNDGHRGKGEEFYQDACALVSRYCIDKRKHDCKREEV